MFKKSIVYYKTLKHLHNAVDISLKKIKEARSQGLSQAEEAEAVEAMFALIGWKSAFDDLEKQVKE